MRQQFTLHTLTAASLTILMITIGCSTQESPDTLTEPTMAPVIELEAATLPQAQDKQHNAGNSRDDATSSSEQITDSVLARNPSMPRAASRKLRQIHQPHVAPTVVFKQPALPKDTPPVTDENTENYQTIAGNPVIRVADQSTSTFSIDVDTGAYSNMRRFLNAGRIPPADAIRIEELLNYFSYDYAKPDNTDQPFSIYTEMSGNPWNENTRLLHIGLKGYDISTDSRPPANLVFLLDVSGSMASDDKLGLLKSSINMLGRQLSEEDTVSIVVYAGASGVVLEPTAGNNKRALTHALNQLQAGGSTNGEAGIDLAYAMAEKSMKPNSINRIILATDGDFNVGISDIEKLKSLIEIKRESGIALTTLGFGSGNYNDHLMEQLANVGNGSYAYIDTLNEARKVLSEEINATLLTIAKDVKIQIEFNPAQVAEYRLLGYVNRALANEDFSNDKVDAGEIGAGHTVTALYEVALVGEGGERHSTSRYQQTDQHSTLDTEIAEIRLRYKQPEANKSQLTKRIISRDTLISDLNQTSNNYRLSAAVAGFAQILRRSKYVADFSYDEAANLATQAKGTDQFGYRAELINLIRIANEIDDQFQAQVQEQHKVNGPDKEG